MRAPGARREHRVLVLQGERATWTLWRSGRCVDERIVPLDDPEQHDVPLVCPWPAAARTLVDVVADSPLDDIERVLAADATDAPATSRRGSGERLRRWLLAVRLGRRHPDAAVRLAPPEAAPLLGALLLAELSESWRVRLETLQRGPVTVRALHSAIRLRTAPTAAPDGIVAADDVLHVLRGSGVERHLLTQAGCPTFTRVVRPDGAAAARLALEETLAHVASRHRVLAPRVRGSGETDDEGTTPSGDARRLAALALGARGRAREGVRLPVLLDGWRRHRELRRLHAVTWLVALVALGTVATAAVRGIDSARERARALAAGEALESRIVRLDDIAHARHADPDLAGASLALLESRRAHRAADASGVLGRLAGVLTAHPDVHVDRLGWSVIAATDAADEAPFASVSNLPVRAVGGGGEAGADVVLVELGGRIDVRATVPPSGRAPGHVAGSAPGRLSIRERQRRFEAFVAALSAADGVAALDVRLSPATAAADGEGGPPLDYELRLRLVEAS